MQRSVLALDPGLRTGWALWHNGEFTCGISDPEDTFDILDRLTNLIGEVEGSTVVVEKFTITAATGKKSSIGMNWPLELTGVARYFAYRWGLEFVQQTPAQMKQYATRTKLDAYGFWRPGREDHHMDAAGHLLLFLRKHNLIPRKTLPPQEGR